MSKLLNFIIKYSIYGLVLLMPLFWLPWTNEVFEFNKLYLLVGLTALALIAWLTKMILVNKKIVFRRTPLDLFILAFMIVMALAAVFSIDSASSWLGFYGRFSDSVIGILAMAVIYFLIVNNIKIQKSTIQNLFLIAGGIVILVSYLSMFQVINIFIGSWQGLSMFLVVVIAMTIGLFLNSKSQILKTIQFLLLLASVILLVLIDFWAAWLVLGLMILFLLVFAFWTRLFKERVNLLLLPIILLLIAGVGGFTDLEDNLTKDILSIGDLPQEVILDSSTAQAITWQAVKERPILGSGPGTFIINFTQYKPLEFNQSQFWNIRFDKAPSYLMELVATTGLLGVISYLAVIGIFLLMVFMGLRKMDKGILPLLLAWSALLIAQFVYLNNLVLLFFFWLFTGLVMVPSKKISFSFKRLPEVALVMNVVLLIFVFGFAALLYLGGRLYLADIKFVRATEVSQLEKVVNLNGYQQIYRRSLSQAYLNASWAEVNNPAEEQKLPLLQAYAQGAIQQAQLATQLSPQSVVAWENLGMIYRNSRGLIGGTIPFAVKAFKQASQLEPNNPLYYREICRLNLIEGEEDLDKTLAYCQKAIDLKDNYLDAHLQLALVYEKKGDLEAALKQMEGILNRLKGVSFQRGSSLAGAATEVYFQLGRLQFNLNHISEAVKMFEQAVIVTPNYANARYGLAVGYQIQGRIQDALNQLTMVNQLVPGNQEVIARIQALSAQLAPQE